nr:histidine phosphatase family protein [Sphingomonas xinjiangensis]
MRHGAPELAGRLLGRTDCGVTAEGIAACVRAAEGLAVDMILTSDLRRSVACAQAIGVPVQADPRWRELDFGEWDGLAAEQVNPVALARFYDDPDAYPPPGGERWVDLKARVRAALAEIHVPTLVVTHGGAMRAVLAQACGLSLRGSWAFDLPYAAILSLKVWSGEPLTAQITGLRA